MAEYNPTYFDYIGDAVTKQFPINFSYITVDEVHVTVDSAPVSFSVASGFVVLPTAPGVGAEVRVLRSTDVRDPKHVFQHGSPLLPGPLDENFRQTLYAVEEAVHTSQDASGVADYAHQLAEQAILDSAHAVSDAAAAVATAGTADQKADSAVATAGSAASTATNALSMAGTAINTANAATSTANAASSTAGTALSTANAATTTANSANSTATQAELKADVAISTANTASSAASAATSTANAADLKATQAVTTADTADTKADTAVSTANSASSTAGAAQTAANSAVSVANAIDGKAQTALDNSVDAVGRVEHMEDIVGNLQAGGVSSFNGRVGSVLPTAGDYSVDDIEGLQLALAAKLEASDLSSNLPELAQAQVENAYSTVFGMVSGQRLSQAITALGLKIGTTGTTAAAGNDSRLSNSREWTAEVVDQAEAEAGTATTARKWTAQRVFQAIAALGLKLGTTGTTAAAGNDSRLSDAREWTADVVTEAVAQAGTDTTALKWTAQRVRQAITGWWGTVGGAFGKTLLNSSTADAARTSLQLGSTATTNSTISVGNPSGGSANDVWYKV